MPTKYEIREISPTDYVWVWDYTKNKFMTDEWGTRRVFYNEECAEAWLNSRGVEAKDIGFMLGYM